MKAFLYSFLKPAIQKNCTIFILPNRITQLEIFISSYYEISFYKFTKLKNIIIIMFFAYFRQRIIRFYKY